MALQLRTVAPAQGIRWVTDGFRLFGKHPLQFTLMFVVFLSAAVLSTALPFVGAILMLAALPLLSLGFMVAAESGLQDGPIHPGHFILPLRGNPARRRSLLILCALYAVVMIAIMLLGNWIDDGGFDRLQRLLAAGGPPEELNALLAEPGFASGLFVRFGLITLASLPFWHAPALVHWGGQGVGQALFSSLLAIWRCRGAFSVYMLAWFGLVAAFGVASALLFGLLGLGGLVSLLALPAGLVFSTAFYVSLLFTFNDSFGGATPAAGS
jgi:hypothetical protein